MMTTVLAIAFVTTFIFSLILFGEPARRRRRVQTQMDHIVRGRLTRRSRSQQSVLTEAAPGGLRGRLAALLDRLLAGRESSGLLETRLRQAGWLIRPGEFVVISLSTGFAALVAALLVTRLPLLRLLIVAVGVAIPFISLSQRIAGRRKAVEGQLIDALTMIAGALRAGYSFLQALEVAARELPQPIAGEFDQVLRECRVNITVEEALANLVIRSGSLDLDMAVTAINIQRQVGGNLGEVLDTICATIRERLKLRGEVRAMTSQQRYSALIIGLLPIVLLALTSLLNPNYVTPMFTHPVGRIALLVGLVMEVIGAVLIRRLVQFEA